MKTARSRRKVQHLLSFSKKIGLKSQIEDAFDEEEAGRVIKYTLKLPEVRRTLRGKRYRILRCFSDTLKNRKEEGRLRYATSVIYNYSDDLTHVIRIDMKTGPDVIPSSGGAVGIELTVCVWMAGSQWRQDLFLQRLGPPAIFEIGHGDAQLTSLVANVSSFP